MGSEKERREDKEKFLVLQGNALNEKSKIEEMFKLEEEQSMDDLTKDLESFRDEGTWTMGNTAPSPSPLLVCESCKYLVGEDSENKFYQKYKDAVAWKRDDGTNKDDDNLEDPTREFCPMCRDREQGVLLSDYLFGLFSGLEKMRYSMSQVQLGCLPRMEVKKDQPPEGIIGVQHTLLESMKMYKAGLEQSGENLAFLLNHFENNQHDLSKLKELMPQMLKPGK